VTRLSSARRHHIAIARPSRPDSGRSESGRLHVVSMINTSALGMKVGWAPPALAQLDVTRVEKPCHGARTGAADPSMCSGRVERQHANAPAHRPGSRALSSPRPARFRDERV
jgi:hypothetical protein